MKVMEQEVAFQSLLHLNYHLFVQVDTFQMVKETVFQMLHLK